MESASYMHIWACSGVYVLIFLTLKIPRDDILLNSSCIFFWFPEDVLSRLPRRFHILRSIYPRVVRRIIFTNSCFDLFHAGHVEYVSHSTAGA